MCDRTNKTQQDTTLNTVHCCTLKETTEQSTATTDFLVLGSWALLSVFIYFLFQRLVKQKAIDKARFFIGYLVLSSLAVLMLVGRHFISDEYFANIVSEVIGIALTVLIIDRVNHYLTDRNEKLHRDIALRHCKMPIYSYCYMWFAIYEPIQTTRNTRLQAYQNLEEFYLSDDFYNSVRNYNFANLIAPNKTFAQYYAEKLDRTEEQFQNILAKYASKLSLEDIQRLEFFGGGSYLYNVFRVMDFLRTVQVSSQMNSNPATPSTGLRQITSFNSVSKENFQKHFKKLIALINDYNAVAPINDQWTIETLNTLKTLSGVNADNYDW